MSIASLKTAQTFAHMDAFDSFIQPPDPLGIALPPAIYGQKIIIYGRETLARMQGRGPMSRGSISGTMAGSAGEYLVDFHYSPQLVGTHPIKPISTFILTKVEGVGVGQHAVASRTGDKPLTLAQAYELIDKEIRRYLEGVLSQHERVAHADGEVPGSNK